MPVEAAGRRPGNCHTPQPGEGAAHGVKATVQVKVLPEALAARASSEGALLGAPRADSGDGAGQERSQSGGGLGTMFPKQGFPGGSAGKESACNAGDPGSIPGLGRSPGHALQLESPRSPQLEKTRELQ